MPTYAIDVNFSGIGGLGEFGVMHTAGHATKCGVGWISYGDNLRISRTYLWISDDCRVTVRVRDRVRTRVRVQVRIRVADCCIQTAGESDKMRINHVIKTD